MSLAAAELAVAKKLIEALEARKSPDSKVRDVRVDEAEEKVVFTTSTGVELDLPISDFIGLYG